MPIAFLLLLIAGAQSQAAQAPRDVPAGARTASIAGLVTEKGSGQPLPRIVVRLGKADPTTDLETLTDADGRYEFSGLEAGDYALSAAPDRHRSTYLPQRFGEKNPTQFFAMRLPPNVEVKAGETRTSMDMALTRALAIEGRVSDPSDEPMAEVQIHVSSAGGPGSFARSASTDDLGMYRVYGLAPGRYRVCADVQGRVDPSASDTASLTRTCYPASLSVAEASDVVLTSQDASGIDVRVQRIRTHSISGMVIDSVGTPVDGAGVGAYSVDETGGSSNATTRGGEFVLEGLPPGRYIVTAGLDVFEPGDPRRRGRDPQVGYAEADVGLVDTTGIAITVSKAISVAGRVRFEGKPRSNQLRMVVQTQPADDYMRRLRSRPLFSPVNDDLRFELKEVFRLPLVVRVQGLPDGWVLKSVRYQGRDITHVPTEFVSPSAGGLELLVTNRVAHPSVRVMDETGAPVTAFHVVTVPGDPARWKTGRVVVPGTPTRDGVLELGAMLPGDYLIAALPPFEYVALLRGLKRMDSLADIATRLRFDERETRTFDLRLASLPPAR